MVTGLIGKKVGMTQLFTADGTYDEVQTVSTAEAMAMARRAAKDEGVFGGPSTGANLVVALRLSERLGPGRRVATVQVDSGLKYLGGATYR